MDPSPQMFKSELAFMVSCSWKVTWSVENSLKKSVCVTSFSFNRDWFLFISRLHKKGRGKRSKNSCSFHIVVFGSADCVQVGQLLVLIVSGNVEFSCHWKALNWEKWDKVISIWLEIQSSLCSAGYWSRRLFPGHKEQSRQIACFLCVNYKL